MTRRRRRAWRALAALLVGLPLAEVGLRAASAAWPRLGAFLGQGRPAVADALLGQHPSPAWWDHDRRGFRNPSAVDRASVVALGDSHTYGVGVEREQAWPACLGRAAGEPVYAMAYGGWGPGHAELLLDRALALGPRVVLATFYSGNDLYDSFQLAWRRRGSGGTGGGAGALGFDPTIQALESEEPLERRMTRLFQAGLAPELLGEERFPRTLLVWRLGRELRRRLAGGGGPDGRLLSGEIYGGRGWRTALTPALRLASIDRRDPRIALGYRLALDSLAAMQSRTRLAGARFAVVLLPTKELVYAAALERDRVAPSPALGGLLAAETALWSDIGRALEERGIEAIPVLAAMRASLERGAAPYPENADGHPNADGHAAIAGSVGAWLEASGKVAP